MASLKDSANAKLISFETLKKEIYTATAVTFSLPANGVQTFNLKTILGDEASKYSIADADIKVYCLDQDAESPTNGYYVSADAVIVTGFKITGEIILKNLYSQQLTCMFRIRVYKRAGV